MQTTREFLAAIKRRHGLKTDGDLHRLLGVSRERISQWQHGKDYLGEENALKVAEALALSPGYVLACVAAERAKSERVKKEWEKMAGLAAVLVLSILILPQLGQHQDAALALFTAAAPTQGLYIMSNQGMLIIALILTLATLLRSPRRTQ